MNEHPFMKHLELALGQRENLKLWRQNCGQVPIKDNRGRVLRVFNAGPPPGAGDLSGIIIPEGWRLEIEVKGLGGKRSLRQRLWGQFIRHSGGVYALVGYDAAQTLEENIATGILTIDAAILMRRVLDPTPNGARFREAFNTAEVPS